MVLVLLLPDDRHHSLLGRNNRLVVLLDLYWFHRAPPDRREDERQADGRGRAGQRPYWAFGLFFMVYCWIDFVISLLTTREVVGWYAAPTRLFQTLMFLPSASRLRGCRTSFAGSKRGTSGCETQLDKPVRLVLLLSLPR